MESNTALLGEEERIAERQIEFTPTARAGEGAGVGQCKYNAGWLNRETLSIPKKSQVTAVAIRAGRYVHVGKFCSWVLGEKSGLFPGKQKQSLLIQTTSITLPSCAKTLNKTG